MMNAPRRLLFLMAVLLAAPAGGQLQPVAPDQRNSYTRSRTYQVRAPDPRYGISGGLPSRTYQGQSPLRSVAFSPHGKFLVSAGVGNTIQLWGVASGVELRRLSGENVGLTRSVAYSPDGKTLAAAGSMRVVRLLEPATGKEIRRLEGHAGEIRQVAYSPDGQTLASAGADRTIRLWNLAGGKSPVSIEGHQGEVNSVAFAPDGRALASGSQDHTVRLWEPATGKEVRRFEGHQNTVESVAFSPDGKILASAGDDQTIRLWDVTTGKEVRRLTGHQGMVLTVTFSPDGRTLASAGADRMVRLWEFSTGQPCRNYSAAYNTVWSVAFSPDGTRLASGSEDQRTRLWDLGGMIQPTGSIGPPGSLDGPWVDLAGGDAARAYDALWLMVGAGKQTVTFVRDHLPRAQKSAPADERRLARLLADLDDDRVEVREKATGELEKLGRSIEPALRKALEGRHSAEQDLRLRLLLDNLREPVLSPDRLRTLRAVAVLEQIGTPDARDVLASLAAGAADDPVSQDARASVTRLDRRPAGR